MSVDSSSQPPVAKSEKDAFEQGLQESYAKGLCAGAVAGLIGSIIWATIAYVTNVKIGWLAIGLGFLVGFAIRLLGKGTGLKYKAAGAVIALVACVLGDYLIVVSFGAKEMHLGIFEMLSSIPLGEIPEIMQKTFSPMDALFYALAAYCGWKYSSNEG